MTFKGVKIITDAIFESQPLLEKLRERCKVATPLREVIENNYDDVDRAQRRAWLREKVALAYPETREELKSCSQYMMDQALTLQFELGRAVSGQQLSSLAVEWKEVLCHAYPELQGTELALENLRDNLGRWIEEHEVV